MIGDRPLDIEAGINAGVATLLLDEKAYFGDIADKKIKIGVNGNDINIRT